MRDIKFRAWDGKKMVQLSLIGLHWELDPNPPLYIDKGGVEDGEVAHYSDHPPMQYTGLKDKNGTEIYEGDIIEKEQFDKPLHNPKKKSIKVGYVVEWWAQKHDDNDHNNSILAADPSAFNQRPGYWARSISDAGKFRHHNWSEFAHCEVIGNIYENPELLK